MKRIGTLAAGLALCCGIGSAQAASSYDNAVAKLVRELLDPFPWQPTEDQPTVAVGWFAYNRTEYTGQFGALLSSDVRAELLRSRKLQVATLDPKKLDSIKFAWMTDAIDPDTVPKAPKGFAAFTLLVRGQYYADIRKHTVALRAQLIDVRSGLIRSTGRASLRRDDAPVPLDEKEIHRAQKLTIELAQTTHAVNATIEPNAPKPRRTMRVRVWAEGFRKVFHEGDKARLKATVDRDAFLYLFNIRPDGSTRMIFPNAYHRDNFVRADTVLTVPGEQMDFHLAVQPPFGDEAVQAIATTTRAAVRDVAARGIEPPTDQANPFKEIEGGASTIATVIRDVRARSLAVQPKRRDEPIPAWAEDHWSFTTKPRTEPMADLPGAKPR